MASNASFLITVLIIIIVVIMWCSNAIASCSGTPDPFMTIAKANLTSHPFYKSFLELHEMTLAHKSHDLDLGMPAFYINLDSNPYRRQMMEFQVKHTGVNMRRIPARNRIWPVVWYGQMYPVTYLGEVHGRLSSNERGCTLSHILAIAAAYHETNVPYVLILEDDAYFMHLSLPHLRQRIADTIRNAPSDWHVLNIYPSSVVCKDFFENSEYVHISRRKCYLTSAYVINRQGMANVLRACEFNEGRITFGQGVPAQADVYIYHAAGNTYNTPPRSVFIVNDSLSALSDIQGGNDLKIQLDNSHAAVARVLSKL